jgi:hypothetical protein
MLSLVTAKASSTVDSTRACWQGETSLKHVSQHMFHLNGLRAHDPRQESIEAGFNTFSCSGGCLESKTANVEKRALGFSVQTTTLSGSEQDKNSLLSGPAVSISECHRIRSLRVHLLEVASVALEQYESCLAMQQSGSARWTN